MTFKQGSWEVKISSPVIPKQVWMLVCNEVPVLSGVRVRKRTHAHNPPLCLHCLGEADSWKECMRGLNCRGFLWYRRWVIGPPQICSYLSQFQSFIHHHYGHYCVFPQGSCWQKSQLRHCLWDTEAVRSAVIPPPLFFVSRNQDRRDMDEAWTQ